MNLSRRAIERRVDFRIAEINKPAVISLHISRAYCLQRLLDDRTTRIRRERNNCWAAKISPHGPPGSSRTAIPPQLAIFFICSNVSSPPIRRGLRSLIRANLYSELIELSILSPFLSLHDYSEFSGTWGRLRSIAIEAAIPSQCTILTSVRLPPHWIASLRVLTNSTNVF